MFPAWAVVHNARFEPIFFSAGEVNAWAGVLLGFYLSSVNNIRFFSHEQKLLFRINWGEER